MIKFSIVTVCLNPGESIVRTVESIIHQNYSNWELIIKDGGSQDNSIQKVENIDNRIRIIEEKDNGIYDAMNRAVKEATGDYFYFLNCGDLLFSEDTLCHVAAAIQENLHTTIVYGDEYVSARNIVIRNNMVLNDYNLMTHTICHQSIFFSRKVFEEDCYDVKNFLYAADMDLYVRHIKSKKAAYLYIPIIVCYYDGDGTSNEVSHRKRIISEKRLILHRYFSDKEQTKIRIKKWVKLIYLKEFISTKTVFSRIYEKCAGWYYRNRENRRVS